MSVFSDRCTGCGDCLKVCPFLEEQGTPDKILAGRPEASFCCTSCRQCEVACPLHLSPADAFFAVKQKLIARRQASSSVRKAMEHALTFAGTGHRAPFSFYGKAETIFWPGCGLAANRPELVRKIRGILSSRLEQKVGLVLDCCYDPVFMLGGTETAFAALREISQRLQKSGAKKVITGCLNCHKLLAEHLPGIEVIFILEVLPPQIFPEQERQNIYLHHPCPASRWESIRNAARNIVNRVDQSDSLPVRQCAVQHSDESEPVCCGAGGGLTSLFPELADRFAAQTTRESKGRTIVTYCTGCQNRFLNKGVKSVHLLEYLIDKPPRRTAPLPLRQWINRLALATEARLKTAKPLILLFVILLVMGGIVLSSQQILSAEALADLLDRHPVLAPLIFLSIYAVAPALFLPSIPLTLAAGFFWGPVWGIVFAISGATLGACLPFFLSRYLLQNFVKTRISEDRWKWFQDKVQQYGWQAVAFTRLIPVFPFNGLNYLFGLTPIPFLQYLWSTFVFMLPACIAFVAFGSTLGELVMRGNIRGVVIGALVAACAFLIPVVLRRFFRKIGDGGTETLDGPSQKNDRE